MDEILLSIAVVAVFLIILIVLLALTTKRVNVLAKKNFVDKLQQYDFLIEDKEKKVNQLDSDIKEREDTKNKLEVKVEKLQEVEEPRKQISEDVIMPRYANLEDDDILEQYKIIKDEFDLNVEKMVKDFIAKNPARTIDMERYRKYKRIRLYFGFKTMFQIENYREDEQRQIVKELLQPEEWHTVSTLMQGEKFSVIKLVERLDEKIVKNDVRIFVKTGQKNKDYNYLDNRIVTEYDEKIVEGFRILYKGMMFDYSI